MGSISILKHFDALKYGSAILAILLTGLILLSTGVFKYSELLGMAVLSYSFGLRHAFDADHIAAIDNMTRKLIQQKKKTKGIGFFFLCGHSTVVIIMGVLTIFAVKWAQRAIPQFQAVGGVINLDGIISISW